MLFRQQQRLLLFVAAALAIAMHMGTLIETRAATVPAAHRRSASVVNIVPHHQSSTVSKTSSFLRRLTSGILQRPAAERRRKRRRSIREAQHILQTDPSPCGGASPASSDTESDSETSTDSTSGNNTDQDTTFPTVTPVSSSTSSTLATPTVTSSSSSTSPSSTSSSVPYPAATVTTGAGTRLVVQSNTVDYGWQDAMNDLNSIMSWAGDDGNLTEDEKTELVAALFSGAARFWPELPTRVIIRIMLADIRAESDFRPRVIGGARLDSGASWGLLQVSPEGGAQWMPFFKQHFNAATHNFTWGIDAPNVRAGVRGPLIDWTTGTQINLNAMQNEDLYRPWINVHLAMWLQTNLARMASADPWMWPAFNDNSWALKQSGTQTLTAQQNSTFTSQMAGAGLPRTPLTALGSWVAGAATNGAGSYTSAGDDVSAPYFAAIMKSISFLYNGANGAQWQPEWLNRWTVNAGLTDYLS